jgi:hypothetical protein
MTPEMEAEVRRRAEADGKDPDAAVRVVSMIVDRAGEKAAAEAGADRTPPAPTKAPEDKPFFQWHTPFVRVFELRERLGLSERIPDDTMTCAEYAAKHGGVAPAPAPGPEPA